MKIKRLMDKYGWETIFRLREQDNYFEIIQKNKELNIKRNINIFGEDFVELLRFLEDYHKALIEEDINRKSKK